MGFPWADGGGASGGGGHANHSHSTFAAQRQSRADSVVARTAARAESLTAEIDDLRGSRQRAAESFGEYELADIKWRASHTKKAGRRGGGGSAAQNRYPGGAAAPLQRMSHGEAQARGNGVANGRRQSSEQRNGGNGELPPCGALLPHRARQERQQVPAQQQQRRDDRQAPSQFKAFRSHTADPDGSERRELDAAARRDRRDRRKQREGGGGGRRRTIGGAEDTRRLGNQRQSARPRRGPVIPRLDLSRLGKFQVGNEKEEKDLVKKQKKKSKAYVYKVRHAASTATPLPRLVLFSSSVVLAVLHFSFGLGLNSFAPACIKPQEEASFYLPQEEPAAAAAPNGQWQDAGQYLADFEEDDSFRNMAQHTY
jgi:hypothetical protein